MLFAVIMLCWSSVSECNKDTAFWVETSDPIFETVDECVHGAYIHVFEAVSEGDIADLRDKPGNAPFEIDIECKKPETKT